MCILLLHCHPAGESDGTSVCSCPYILVAADNRDEYFDRPTKPLHFWPDQPNILAGRDVMRQEAEEQGTWMGVSKEGRLAVLTNFRCNASELRPDATTRGKLVSEFLNSNVSPEDYSHSVMATGHMYNGFSLVTAHIRPDGGDVMCCSNRSAVGEGVVRVGSGTYALSNSMFDVPWRKVERGKDQLKKIIKEEASQLSKSELTDKLMRTLADDTCLHPDPNIPDTGFNREALLHTSSVFVRPVKLYGKWYGTRTSSVILVDQSGEITYTERTLKEPVHPEQSEWIMSSFSFQAW